MQSRGDAEGTSHKVVPVLEVIWCGGEVRYKVTLVPCSHRQPVYETMTSSTGEPIKDVTWRGRFQERLALLRDWFPPVTL